MVAGRHQPEVQRVVGYYRGTAEQDRVLTPSGAPVTLVRSAQ